MKIYAELYRNVVRHIAQFEDTHTPEAAFPISYVDITNVKPRPAVGWRYDFGTKTFIEDNVLDALDHYGERKKTAEQLYTEILTRLSALETQQTEIKTKVDSIDSAVSVAKEA